MLEILSVAGGGALGALARWRLAVHHTPLSVRGTLVANVAGTILLGALVVTGVGGLPALLLGTGVAGGLTTFSTVMAEVVVSPRGRATYLALTLAAGLAVAAVAMWAG